MEAQQSYYHKPGKSEIVKAAITRYRQTDKGKATLRKYQETHREQIRDYMRTYRQRKREAMAV